jgi:hypothetical protein
MEIREDFVATEDHLCLVRIVDATLGDDVRRFAFRHICESQHPELGAALRRLTRRILQLSNTLLATSFAQQYPRM